MAVEQVAGWAAAGPAGGPISESTAATVPSTNRTAVRTFRNTLEARPRRLLQLGLPRRPGTLLGRPAEWYLIGADDDPTLLRREALVDLGQDQLHVSSATRDPALESELDLILAAFEPSPAR